MAAIRQRGPTPVGLWEIINSLAKGRNPDSRAMRRCWRLRYLGAGRELVRAKVLYRHGSLIALKDFAVKPRPRPPKRLSAPVGRLASEFGGSNPVLPVAKTTATSYQVSEPKVVVTSLSTPPGNNEMKSAAPTELEISAAASALAQLPRTRKKWSGWLNGERMWRLRLVVVPGGRVLPAYFVRRGFVYVLLPDTAEFADRVFERYRAEDVQIYRSPHAALLGRLPPIPGRKRGRPRGSGVPVQR